MKPSTKKDYRPDLQPYCFRFRLLVRLLHYRWGMRLAQVVLGFSRGSQATGLDSQQVWLAGSSGSKHRIRVRIYRPAHTDRPLPAMLYLHGGGYALGLPEQAHRLYKALIAERPVVIVAPDYRLSLRHPFPAGFQDACDTLLWMQENQEQLRIASDRFVVAGHSAGGGLAAALALWARDTGRVKIAFQMPVYPMLDYRQNTPSCRQSEKTPLWDGPANRLAWSLYLKDLMQKKLPVPAYASPALNEDFAGLPPAISFVGSLEPFRDEVVAYMERLENAGVEVRFKVFDGAFHAAELYSGGTDFAREVEAFQMGAFGDFFDASF